MVGLHIALLRHAVTVLWNFNFNAE